MDDTRREELTALWNEEADEEWREELTAEERDFLAGLDKQYRRGLLRMCEDALTMDLIRRRFKPTAIAEVTAMRGHCRLRLRTGELYNARLSKQRTLLLEAVDPVC
ncbi:MAG: hypothetical protein HFF60_12600 [Oscillospiraceae bacterium]|jgi:hypothetical protein|nr:hypothetical protein [Oscillospiraceae bacterium]